MSRESEGEPRPPKTKTSTSAIYEAFKNLTSNKNRKNIPGPTTAESLISPSIPHTPSTQSSREALKRVNIDPWQGRGRHGFTADFMGGPIDMQNAVHQLRRQNSIISRIHAARQITGLLAQYPVDNVDAIWDTARDIVDVSDEQGAIEAGYGLLLACVKHKSLNARERLFFLRSIGTDQRLETLQWRLEILNELTHHAKYLDHLEVDITSLLVPLLEQSFDSAIVERRQNKAIRDAPADAIPLVQTFQYVQALFKFNASVLAESDLVRLINNVLVICKRTGAKSDISNSIDILDAVVTYSLLPHESLRPCLEVLCATFYIIKTLRGPALATIRKLLHSHLGPSAILDMLGIIQDRTPNTDNLRYTIRGAISVMHAIFVSDDEVDAGIITPVLGAFLSALNMCPLLDKAPGDSNPTDLRLWIMKLLLEIIQRESKPCSFLDSSDWVNLSTILIQCSQVKRITQLAHLVDSGSSDFAPAEQQIDSPELQGILAFLMGFCKDEDFEYKRILMDLFLQLAAHMSDNTAQALIKYYDDEQLLMPPLELWLHNCRQLHLSLLKNRLRSSDVRLLCLDLLKKAFKTAEALNISQATELFSELFDEFGYETDSAVFEALCTMAVDIGSGTGDTDLFRAILTGLLSALPDLEEKNHITTRPLSSNSAKPEEVIPSMSSYNIENVQMIVRGLVRLFLRNIQSSRWKSQTLFTYLLRIAGSPAQPSEGRVVALKLLARLRSDINNALYVIADPGCQNLAASLCRTSRTVREPFRIPDSPISRPVRSEEQLPRRKNQSAPAAAPHTTRAGSNTRSASGVNWKNSKAVAPSWQYGGRPGLPEDPPFAASHFLFSHLDDQFSELADSQAQSVLNIDSWLELVISILQQPQDQIEWETFSYIIVHMGAQLTNHSLFVDAIPQIKLLRTILCNQLNNKTFLEPPVSTNLKKGDVAICLYDILTTLISYREHFARNEEDEMVRVIITGIGTWERTSEVCIHALSVCCLEFPASVTKVLESALLKMAQIITQLHIAVHVLEFLAGLARSPELFLNFREPEYKTVFGMCFRYLQFAREQSKKATPVNPARNSKGPSTGIGRDTVVLDTSTISKSLADELPQYVYALAYHVITFFFMSLRLRDRPLYMEWISKNLMYRDDEGKEIMEEQSQVTVDYMRRISHTDRDETAPDPDFARLADGVVAKKSWLLGLSILTVETAGRTGVSQLTHRGPSGTKFSVVRPNLKSPPRHQVAITHGSAADAFYSGDYVGVTPDDVIQELYFPLGVLSPAYFADGPIPLPDDEATQRSIATFDRISPLDGHKVGIIYIGEGQTTETTILSNVMGSEDYTAFLEGIGTLTELKNATFNTQGLDREFDSDGKFTFCWRNRVTELVFHVTTMMPTDLENDPLCANKKRHTGNDFVNIIFNNSGHPFDFNTFPSDFNYVNIEIVPEARTSFVETRLRAAELRRHRTGNNESTGPTVSPSTTPGPTLTPTSAPAGPLTKHGPPTSTPTLPFYKVTVHTKPGLPPISAASDTKILSGASLPAFVRLLALNASVFALVWANRDVGEPVSSWRSRLREIVRLRERHPAAAAVPGTMTVGGGGGGGGGGGAGERELGSREREALMASPVLGVTPFTVSAPNPPSQSEGTAAATSGKARDSGVSGVGGSGGGATGGNGGGTGNIAVGLLRRMSQATFITDIGSGGGGGVGAGAGSSTQRSSVTGSGTGSADRSSSVGSRGSRD